MVARKGNTEVVKALIEAGADVNAKDNDGWTVLSWACTKNNKDIAQLLIENGANVNAKR